MKASARQLLGSAAALVALGFGACSSSLTSIPPIYGTADLYAIHNEADWTPRSPARLSSSPSSYEIGFPVEGIRVAGEERWYDITDHNTIELQIIDKIAETPPFELTPSTEALAVLVIELLHDDHREARMRAVTILSAFAGAWIERGGTTLASLDPNADLGEAVENFNRAVEAVDDPNYVTRVAEALDRIDSAPVRDPLIAARLVTGMSRRMTSSPLQTTGNQVIMRTGVRAVLLALEKGMGDYDRQVADFCRANLETIRRYLPE